MNILFALSSDSSIVHFAQSRLVPSSWFIAPINFALNLRNSFFVFSLCYAVYVFVTVFLNKGIKNDFLPAKIQRFRSIFINKFVEFYRFIRTHPNIKSLFPISFWWSDMNTVLDSITKQDIRQFISKFFRSSNNAHAQLRNRIVFFCDMNTSIPFKKATNEMTMKFGWYIWILKNVRFSWNNSKLVQTRNHLATINSYHCNSSVIHLGFTMIINCVTIFLDKFLILIGKHKLFSATMDCTIRSKQSQYPCHSGCPNIKKGLVVKIFSAVSTLLHSQGVTLFWSHYFETIRKYMPTQYRGKYADRPCNRGQTFPFFPMAMIKFIRSCLTTFGEIFTHMINSFTLIIPSYKIDIKGGI